MTRWQQGLSEKFILKPNQHEPKNFKVISIDSYLWIT